MHEVAHGRAAPPDVDHVVDELEGEEGDAERQQDVRGGEVEAGGAGGVEQEVGVLEIGQHAEVGRHGERQPGAAAAPRQQQAEAVVDHRQREDQRQVTGIQFM